jgi:hypothetical protein
LLNIDVSSDSLERVALNLEVVQHPYLFMVFRGCPGTRNLEYSPTTGSCRRIRLPADVSVRKTEKTNDTHHVQTETNVGWVVGLHVNQVVRQRGGLGQKLGKLASESKKWLTKRPPRTSKYANQYSFLNTGYRLTNPNTDPAIEIVERARCAGIFVDAVK